MRIHPLLSILFLSAAIVRGAPDEREAPRRRAAAGAVGGGLQFPVEQLAPAGTKRALILCGLPGDKDHRQPFAETVEKIRGALIDRHGFTASEIRLQFAGPVAEGAGPVLAGVRGRATREDIETEAAELRQAIQPEDTLWVIVIGHAHYDGKHVYFNVPGPDITEQEFGKLFAGLEAREQVFFITIPTSGYFIKHLSAKGRIVITATEPDLEVNETLFPLALADVLSAPPPMREFDADRDGIPTLFDLYVTLARNIAKRYADEELLSTEHAQLDDNGDGRGTELQIDYLTVEQGGRAKPGKNPPPLRENGDGHFALRIAVPLPPPVAAEKPPVENPPVENPPEKTPTEEPDQGPADQ
jgi:hypothetical protein